MGRDLALALIDDLSLDFASQANQLRYAFETLSSRPSRDQVCDALASTIAMIDFAKGVKRYSAASELYRVRLADLTRTLMEKYTAPSVPAPSRASQPASVVVQRQGVPPWVVIGTIFLGWFLFWRKS